MTEAFVRHDAGVQYLTSPLLASYGIPHLFSLRGGGVSDGVFASLNFAQGGGTLRDTAENVFENHARAAAVLGLPPSRVCRSYQTHSLTVRRADDGAWTPVTGIIDPGEEPAIAAVREYATVEDLFQLAQERGEPPFFVLCDELEDPHNLGAIIRTAECAGAHGVIIPKRRSVGLTWAVGKASAGAVEHLPVARVGNLASTLEELKARGLWVYAADMDGAPWCQTDFTGPVALVIGSEGRGVSRLVKEKADFVVSLPLKGKINSLNASVAAGILCYEVSRQRGGLKAVNP